MAALCRRNVLWWSQTYGCSLDATQYTQELDGFYRAIRDNHVELVQRYIVQHPAAVFTKAFGKQRTALHVASFFGRHKVVKLLLRHGADKDLLCDGVRPLNVAGFGCADPIDRMKVVSLLQGDVCPQVILRLDDKQLSTDAAQFRLQIHFSEAVDEFTAEDVTVSNGDVTRFSMLRRDLYLVTVKLHGSSSVEVAAGAARAGGRCNAQSRPFHLG